MDSNWASEHLQIIRTLMERSALYRRALAPVMLIAGIIGLGAAATALCLPRFESNGAFAGFWMGTAALTLAISYLLVRRQALEEDEPFWSPPTRRVTQAMVPGFLAGGSAGLLVFIGADALPPVAWLLAVGWVIVYGCALHAGGLFMERGIKLFGLSLVATASVLLIGVCFVPLLQTTQAAHAVMGLVFGAAHFCYGGYLHFTERGKRS